MINYIRNLAKQNYYQNEILRKLKINNRVLMDAVKKEGYEDWMEFRLDVLGLTGQKLIDLVGAGHPIEQVKKKYRLIPKEIDLLLASTGYSDLREIRVDIFVFKQAYCFLKYARSTPIKLNSKARYTMKHFGYDGITQLREQPENKLLEYLS